MTWKQKQLLSSDTTLDGEQAVLSAAYMVPISGC